MGVIEKDVTKILSADKDTHIIDVMLKRGDRYKQTTRAALKRAIDAGKVERPYRNYYRLAEAKK